MSVLYYTYVRMYVCTVLGPVHMLQFKTMMI